MKTKMLILNLMFMISASLGASAQTAAVYDLNINGLDLSPEIAGKLTRIELIKTQKYKVLDEFDMQTSLEGKGNFKNCFGKNCLVEIGKILGVDLIFSGSIDQLGTKIVITLKMIDVKNKTVLKSTSMEFMNQDEEIQRMLEIVLNTLLDSEVDQETARKLKFNNELITSTNVGRVSNSGPRFGISYVGFGEFKEFFMRSKREGGYESVPLMSNIGYQFEAQYVGTENFAALFEVIPNVGGMEQGHFIPTLSLLNGFRFGKGGWEFAFGPSFGARKMLEGMYVDGTFMNRDEYYQYDYESWLADPANTDDNGNFITVYEKPQPTWAKRMDTRGNLEFNTNWLMAFGKTFRTGALNIPVNIYYSGNKFGGVIGTSVGFNIVKSKKSINQNIKP